tara:strand:+ start:40 stop:240 length:201 start_codon:yes stop_codon:yes gene_type:complete
MNTEKQESALIGELTDTQWELAKKVEALQNAEWDSPTLKKQIKEILAHHWKINDELNSIYEKESDK